ncbi:MAG: hypothetical protein IPK79_05110 [Vampirovibrionales bacterium]|nr:hypothetical protein [Vampirovibrionales bacterium]
MSSVQLSKFSGDTGIFKKFDKDNNGLDKKEINAAAQDAIKNKDYNTAGLLGTMAVGGKDNQGLMHDVNKDGRISQDELKQFAGLAGKKDEIDTADFSAGFGDAAKDNNFFAMLDTASNAQGADKSGASEGAEESGDGGSEECSGGDCGGSKSASEPSAAGQAGQSAPSGGGGESGGGGAPAGGAQGANQQQQQPQNIQQIMAMIMQLLQVLMQQMGVTDPTQQQGQTQPGAATNGLTGATGATAGGAAPAQVGGNVRPLF